MKWRGDHETNLVLMAIVLVIINALLLVAAFPEVIRWLVR